MTITLANGTLYPASLIEWEGSSYAAYRSSDGAQGLAVAGDLADFTGEPGAGGVLLCPRSPANLAALRARLPWLKPVPLGLSTSFGFGDRLGRATPGHIAALRTSDSGLTIAPILAQQSVRENSRTGRTPQQVLDDATWGVFTEGWRAPWGADADHVKEIADLAPFVAAGYTFYTIDPSDHVDNDAQTDDPATLRSKVAALPWERLGTSYADLERRYLGQSFALDGLTLVFEELHLLRALAKYGRAVAHAVAIADALSTQVGGGGFELEMSVDETDTPTSDHEHFFIASELLARDLPLVSLAPRFVGKFQKGVDYIGDVAPFEAELVKHIAIMRWFDRYKLSVHTGSDKFSLYPLFARYTQGRVHVKTAGTSYLEALRLAAQLDPALFRAALETARTHFAYDRKTYFLDAQLERVPAAADLSDDALPGLLDQFDARQVIHVTFGSILSAHGAALDQLLDAHAAAYQELLVQHFGRHLGPFVARG